MYYGTTTLDPQKQKTTNILLKLGLCAGGWFERLRARRRWCVRGRGVAHAHDAATLPPPATPASR